MAVTPEERRTLLQQISQLAETQLNQLWEQASQLANADFAVFMVEAFPQLADPYFQMAGDLAATWFELSDPASLYRAMTAPPLAVEKLVASTQWALGATGDAAKDRLQGTLQRAVFDGARQTTLINIERTQSYWIRHARPDACTFCRMLATRHSDPDYWYTSNDAALQVVGRGSRNATRGSRKVGEKYHDHCYCIAVEVREGQEYEPPEYVQKWDDEYEKAVANAGSRGDVKAIQAAWRQVLSAE